MSVDALRNQVKSRAGLACTPSLLCITGASGVGKTATLEALREQIEARFLPTLAFDSLGVPPVEHMHAGWESPRGWQKSMTWFWVQTAKHVFRTHPLVVLEGSFDPQFAIAACSANRLRLAVVLLDAPPEIRRERLARRGQPELATDDMDKWASYLVETTTQLGGTVVDASVSIEKVVDAICARAIPLFEAEPAPPTPRRN